MAASASNLLLPKDLLYKSRKVKWGDSKYGYSNTFCYLRKQIPDGIINAPMAKSFRRVFLENWPKVSCTCTVVQYVNN